jgi:TRAP-type mannitol/chloroaromatic compound transport system permease large subunit
MTIFYPKSAPALPLEARTLSDPDRSGAISFLVLLAVTIAFTIGATIWLRARMETGAEISAVFLGVAFAFLVALANRLFKLGLLSRLAEQVVFVLVPPLALIFLVLGTIFIGVATPTEGGAMGAAGALILAFFKRRLSLDLMNQAMQSTAKLSAFVIFILVGARVFSLTFYGVNGHKWVEELLVGLPGGEVGFLIVVNILVFLLAFFLDFFELAFIIIPLLGPAAERLGIDLIWFGVVMAVNMQTSFMHPPFGFALFYLRSVAPREPYIDKITKRRMEPVTTGQIYWGAVPFVVIQVIMVGLVIAFPGMVMHYKGVGTGVDPASIQQLDIPQMDDLPPLDFGAPPGLEGGGAPPGLEGPASPPEDLGPPPGLEGPPPGLEAPPPPQPAQ